MDGVPPSHPRMDVESIAILQSHSEPMWRRKTTATNDQSHGSSDQGVSRDDQEEMKREKDHEENQGNCVGGCDASNGVESSLESQDVEICRLSVALEDAHREGRRLLEQVVALKSERGQDRVDGSVDGLLVELNGKDAEFIGLRNQIADLHSTVERLNATADTKEQALRMLSMALDEGTETFNGFREQVTTANTAMVESHAAELARLTEATEVTDGKMLRLTTTSKSSESKVLRLTAESKRKEVELARLMAESKAKEAEMMRLTAESKAKEAEVMRLTAESNAKDTAIYHVRMDAKAKTSQEMNQLKCGYESQLEKVRNELIQLKENVTNENAKKEQNRVNGVKDRVEMSELRARLTEKLEELASARHQISGAHFEIEETKKDTDRRLARLHADNSRLLADSMKYSNSSLVPKVQVDQLHTLCASLKRDLARAGADVTRLEVEKRISNDQVHALLDDRLKTIQRLEIEKTALISV